MSSKRKEVCMMCGKESKEIICDKCKAHVQADAVAEKKKMEKGINVGAEVLADRAVGHKN